MPTKTVTANYTVMPNDEVILVNAPGGATIYLPGSHTIGQRYIVKDLSGNAQVNNIVIAASDPDTIDQSPTFGMNMNYQAIIVHSDGSNWYVI